MTQEGIAKRPLLRNGEVLIVGGSDGTGAHDSAELYDPASGTFVLSVSALSAPRQEHTATLLSSGKVLVAGGRNGTEVSNTGETYDPDTDGFAAVTNTLATARASHSATLLPNGKVLLAGGTDGTSPVNSGEVYEAASNTFTPTNSLVAGRAFQTATLLPKAEGGYLRITSKFGLLFTEILAGDESLSAVNGIDVSKFSGVTKVYSPMFAVLPGFNSVLNLINGAPEDSEVTITLHAADGRVIGSPVKKLIPMHGQLRGDLVAIFDDAPELRGRSGWIEVEGTLDPLMGTITFSDDDETFQTTFQLLAKPEKEFVFPVLAADETYMTGTALLNPGEATANVTLELWGPGGTLDRSTTFQLLPKAQSARYLTSYFPDLEPRLIGNIRIRADQPLFGISVINDANLDFISAVPAVPLR